MSMTDDEIIAVVTHRKNGGGVEWRETDSNESWEPKDPNASWDFIRNEYRPKPVDMVLHYRQSFLCTQGRPDPAFGDVAITFDADSGEPKKVEVVK